MSKQNSDYYFLQGGGEMGELIRAKDWSKTSLGDPSSWPQSLCTMVSVMLENPFGMYIAWGDDYTQLYNVGYRPILGSTKHPQALGISTRETFAEIWHIIGSMFEGVMKGQAVGFPDLMLPLNRNGFFEECFFDFSYSPIRKDDGEVGGVLVTVIETTDKKKAEEALKASEERFRDTVRQAPVGITILRGKEYVVEMANDFYLELVDRKINDFIGRPLFDSLPEVKESVAALLEGVLTTGVPLQGIEVPVPLQRYGNHDVLYFDFLYHPLREKDGEISGIIVTVTEVTEKVVARKKIKEKETLLQSIFFNAPVAIAVIQGPDHTYVMANNEYQNMVSRTSEQLLEKASKAIFPELIGTGTFEIFDGIYQSGESFSIAEYPVKLDKKNEGSVEQLYFRFSAVPLKDAEGKFDSIVIVSVDITEQIIARKKIEQSEKKFQAAILAIEGIIWTNNNKGQMIGEQPGWAKLTGQRFEEYQGYGWATAIHPDDAKSTVAAWDKAVANKTPFEFEHRVKTTQNEWRLFSVKAVPVLDENGIIQQWVGVHTDITEQREAIQKIKESEERFKSLADESPMFVFIIEPDPSAPVSYWNKTWLYYTGQTAEQAAGRSWDGIIHPEDFQVVMDFYVPAFNARQAYFIPAIRVLRFDGEYRWHSVKGNPRYLDNGEFNGYVGVGFDIHEQKLAEEKLAYRTALLEAHNEASVDGLLLVDAKGKILSFNQRFIEIWNMPLHITHANDDEGALSFAMTQLVHPQQFIDKVKYLYDNPTETSLDELEFIDGKIVERNGYPVIGEESQYYAWSWTFKDITERKRIEQDLKNTKEQLELTFKNIPAGVYLINAKGEMVYVNDRGAAVYGDFTPEYILEHKDLTTLLKIADELFERFDENGNYFSSQNSPAFISLVTGEPSQAVLRQINRVTREQRWYYVQGAPLFDQNGSVSLVLITSTDITEQKNAEEKTKESEERFRSLAQTLPQLVWVTDVMGVLEFASVRWEEYTGIEPGSEKEWEKIVHPDDLEGINAVWAHCLSSGDTYTSDVRLRSKNGEYRWHTVMGEPVLDNENKIVKWVGAFTDTHQEKLFMQELELKVKERTNELEQFNIELERKNKELESFAYISSHDLQEPLRKIQILATRIIERESLSEIGRDSFSRMQLAAKRMQTLIEDLLTYSKTSTDDNKFENTNLNTIIDEVKEDLSEEIKEKNAIIEATELCELEIIPFQFRQLMHNLIGNGLKFSVPNRIPHIQIKSVIAYGRQFDNEKLKSESIYCQITVSDNGIGFEQQYSEKIFEVFQRLHGRNDYKGTGIGLAIVKKIVENHEGVITASSELNKGTTFNIYIPVR